MWQIMMRTRFGDSKEEHGKVSVRKADFTYNLWQIESIVVYNPILIGGNCKIT